MEERAIDGVLLTDEANVIYFTGFETEHLFATRSRMVGLVIPTAADPQAVVPRSHLRDVREQTGLEVLPYDSLRHAPVDALAPLLARCGRRIGLELGFEQRVDMTLQDADRLRAQLDEAVDISEDIWQLRMTKSPTEQALIQHACRIGAEALESAIPCTGAGDTERSLANRISAEVASRGGRVAFLIMTSGAGSYHRANGAPRDRVLQSGDFIFIDLGVRYRGYHSDFNRNVVVEAASPEQSQVQDTIKEITEQAARRLVIGTTAADVYHAILDDCRQAGLDLRIAGRVGHGIGLGVTEPPHISAEDATPLREGMVTTIEPMLACEKGLFCAEIIYAVGPHGGQPLNRGASLLVAGGQD